MPEDDDSAVELAGLRDRLAAPKLTTADLFACGDAILGLAQSAGRLDLPVQRIAIAGDLTVDLLARAVACAVLQEGRFPLLHTAPYGAMVQEILAPDSDLHRFRPEMALLVPDWRAAVPPLPPDAAPETIAESSAGRLDLFRALWSALEQRSCAILQHMLVPPPMALRGMAERRSPASTRRRVEELNAALIDAGDGRVTWLEADRLAARVGLGAWSAARFYHAGKLGFDPRFLPDYLPWFRGAWRTATGRAKKVLVLDLDDTLWGGAIGDEGVEGIALGPDHGAVGEAFAAWQDHLAQLARRGVVLAVCSKNDPALATVGFGHPQAALSRDDFAAIVCSWEDKAAGLRRIAAELSVGLDALVFADDNPAETALVRQLLPEVEVVELGSDPAQFIDRLEGGHWFDLQTHTDADLGRNQAYLARRLATDTRSDAADLGTYLAGLKMVGTLRPAEPADLPRMAQLELKTNQFNLTTRRYAQASLASFLEDRLVVTLSLRDRFGDHGLVSSLVAVEEGDALRIDGWLMSCRVFGRTAEPFMLAGLVRLARERGVAALVGEYLPTARNSVVADLYRRLGFDPISGDGRLWRRGLDQPTEDLATWITPG